uniref:Uncharacterized protein n=1 Tax=Kalanchoe fedtschenkoi TaxID=63787 RepID=A0A7N0TF30_KALFE
MVIPRLKTLTLFAIPEMEFNCARVMRWNMFLQQCSIVNTQTAICASSRSSGSFAKSWDYKNTWTHG